MEATVAKFIIIFTIPKPFSKCVVTFTSYFVNTTIILNEQSLANSIFIFSSVYLYFIWIFVYFAYLISNFVYKTRLDSSLGRDYFVIKIGCDNDICIIGIELWYIFLPENQTYSI
jgi:hypothetical protein